MVNVWSYGSNWVLILTEKMHLVLCSVFLFTCKTQLAVLTSKISAGPSEDSAVSFCSGAV